MMTRRTTSVRKVDMVCDAVSSQPRECNSLLLRSCSEVHSYFYCIWTCRALSSMSGRANFLRYNKMNVPQVAPPNHCEQSVVPIKIPLVRVAIIVQILRLEAVTERGSFRLWSVAISTRRSTTLSTSAPLPGSKLSSTIHRAGLEYF